MYPSNQLPGANTHHSSSNYMNPNSNPETGASLVVANPYWPEYQQPSHPPALPLNYYTSPAQHQQHVASIAPMEQPALAPTEPARREPQQQHPPPTLPSSKPLNQNQVHAQTHPWRIKVYNACLACRKKKIKCDGQPTCQRCQRLGFECSYIEVPHTPAPKVSKPSKPKNPPMDEPPASNPSSSSAKPPSKRHHHHAADPPSGFLPPSKTVKAVKEIRQQRRSSTKDAASGSFPHSTSRRKDTLPAKDHFIDQPRAQPFTPLQIPSKDQQRPPSDVAPAPNMAKPMGSFALDRDASMPDLYYILVNSVTIPNVSKYTQPTSSNATPNTGPVGGAILMGMDHLNLTLASPVFPTFTVLNSDQPDPDQHHSIFQKDPTVTSFLDQSTPLGFVITNKSVIQYLVHVYFECFHHHWMIVDKQKFLAQLKDPASPPDPLLLVAICAAGAKYSDHEGLCAEPGNLSTIGEQFLTHARILLQDRFDMPSMSTLQALLILYWCQVQTGRASLRFMYVGMAIRMAQEIGLNRPLDPKRLKDMDEREVQIRKTIWWSCYQADRWTSAALGKPMVISDVDCVVDYPTSVDPGEKFYVDSFCHMSDLAKILGKIILHLYTSTNASTCSSAVFSHLDQSLSAWIASMPSTSDQLEASLPTPVSLDSATNTPTRKTASPHPHQRGRSTAGSKSGTPDSALRLAPDSNAPEPGAVGYYALLYHTARIMLYRPFLHSSTLTPTLPLTLQSPLSRCRESAVAISEIAETMVTEQRSYRQLFNSIHFSLCAAATVHRFVLVSPKGSLDPSRDLDSLDAHTPTEDGGIATTSTNTPATLSKGPMSSKTDLYYLALLLRILQSCCRFSIEKPLLRSIIDNYLPQRFLSAEDLAWMREEVHRNLVIVPFSIKLPFQTPGGNRSMVALNLSSGSTPLQSQQQQQSRSASSTHQSPKQLPEQQQQDSLLQQYQGYEYQKQLRQQQLGQQQQAKQQQQQQQQPAQREFTGSPSITSMMSNPDMGPFTPGADEEMTLTLGRSNVRMDSISDTSYVANVPTDPSMSEQFQMQQYQHELDLLHEQHRNQQTELSQHHQQQTLQLQQAQIIQQQQQNLEYEDQQQKQQVIFVQEQQQQEQQQLQQQYGAPLQSPTFARNRTGSGVMSPKSPYSNPTDPVITRNKRQSDGSSSKKHKKQQDRQQIQQQQQQQDQHHHQRQHRHHQQQPQEQQPQQQPAQGLSQQDSSMAEAAPPNLDPSMALSALKGLAGSDEMMTTNSAPSVISQQTGTTDMSGRSGIASLDELLGLEPSGYYPDLRAENSSNTYAINTSDLPMTSPSCAEEQRQTHLIGSSNTSEQLWYGNNNNNNGNNQQGRGSFSIGSNSNSPGDRQGKNGVQSHRSSISSDNSSMQRAQSNINNQGGRIPNGPVMIPQGPMNTTWLGLGQLNSAVLGATNQLPPLRQGDAPIGYPYPYSFTYSAQPSLRPLSPMGQPQPIPYVIARSIPYSPGHPYVYAADGNAPMGVYVPSPIPQATQGAPAFDGPGLIWQQHPPFAVPHTMLSPQMVTHQDQDVQMYSPRLIHHGYPGQQQQGPGHQHYHHQQQQPGAYQSQTLTSQQQQQQQQAQSMYVLKAPQQELQQQQQYQQEQNQQRKAEQVRHPSATLLPPLPQNVYRQENRPFSPTSSNTTLVNTTSNSNSSTQQESSRDSRSGRETSTGGDSTGGPTTSDSQFESSQSSSGRSNRQSRSAGSFTEGSNESSSNTESPNSTGDLSNSNESGSSSDNNPGSRSSSADPAVASTSGTGGSSEGGSGSGSGSGSGDNGNSGTTSTGKKSSRGQKFISPSGSGDSSSPGPASSTSPPSKAETQAARQQHYRAHQQAQEAGSGDTSSSSGGGSVGSGRSGSMSSSNGGSNNGSRQSGGRRRRKNKYHGGNNGPSPGSGGHGPNGGGGGASGSAGAGGTGGASAGSNTNAGGNASSGSSGQHKSGGGGGRGSPSGQGRSGGSHRADSDSAGSGSGSSNPAAKATGSSSYHHHQHRRNNSGAHGGGHGGGTSGGSSHGSGGGGSKSRSNRKGKGWGVELIYSYSS
ncbi:MAG: fungal-specific transcription factor domain-containing protein [Linnemannia gamsii]|nr:MAG: fungal-specific transcription factor domain-containing protein [Linnemannia gamsii]